LSKIFILAEKDIKDLKDENIKKLSIACKGLQDSLLDFANYKPVKGEKNKKYEEKFINDNNFKHLLDRIMEFKYIHIYI
jgi:myb proto-oncogene protein